LAQFFPQLLSKGVGIRIADKQGTEAFLHSQGHLRQNQPALPSP
jgi:hypothetical protein